MPGSKIILMPADDVACDSRNTHPGSVFSSNDRQRRLDLYGDNIEVDYRGYEVTVKNLIRVLTDTPSSSITLASITSKLTRSLVSLLGRVDPTTHRSKRLLTDSNSNIFVYMTGHGGNEFLKFQDNEEISAFDVADTFETMWQKKRYQDIVFMIDTCQANTMCSQLYSPNILATGSSKLGENSYSHESDAEIGVAVIDKITHYILHFMEGINKTSKATVQDLFSSYTPKVIALTPGVRSDLLKRPLSSTLVTDFFGGVARSEVDESIATKADKAMDEPFSTATQQAEEISGHNKIVHLSEHLANMTRRQMWSDIADEYDQSRKDIKKQTWAGLALQLAMVCVITMRSI